MAVQRAVCYYAAVGVLCSGVVLWYRERYVSVLFVMYFVAVWYCGTESVLLVCCLWCIV